MAKEQSKAKVEQPSSAVAENVKEFIGEQTKYDDEAKKRVESLKRELAYMMLKYLSIPAGALLLIIGYLIWAGLSNLAESQVDEKISKNVDKKIESDLQKTKEQLQSELAEAEKARKQTQQIAENVRKLGSISEQIARFKPRLIVYNVTFGIDDKIPEENRLEVSNGGYGTLNQYIRLKPDANVVTNATDLCLPGTSALDKPNVRVFKNLVGFGLASFDSQINQELEAGFTIREAAPGSGIVTVTVGKIVKPCRISVWIQYLDDTNQP